MLFLLYLTYVTQYDTLKSIHVATNGIISFFKWLSNTRVVNFLFFFLKNLRNKLYTVKLTILKHKMQWFSVGSQGYATLTTIQPHNTFMIPKRG